MTVIGDQIWADPLLVRCARRAKVESVQPKTICVFVLPGPGVLVDPGVTIELQELAHVVERGMDGSEPPIIVVRVSADTLYGDFMSVLDEVFRVAGDMGIPDSNIKIAGCRYTGLSGEVETW